MGNYTIFNIWKNMWIKNKNMEYFSNNELDETDRESHIYRLEKLQLLQAHDK